MRKHRCPDCGVTMEGVTFDVPGSRPAQIVTGESKMGLLGTFGVNERADLTTVMCPECGLVRHYAAVDE